MRFLHVIFFCFVFPSLAISQFNGNQTPTYPDLIRFYDSVSTKNNSVELYNFGLSDYGLPIYVCVLNGEKDSLETVQNKSKKSTVFINNGIHPGEPDGINACGQLTLDYLKNQSFLPKNVRVAFILCYNVGGAMNRGSFSRANQDGPAEYGFRGNAQNLDLNRDFIKMDSKNAFAFARAFQAFNPDVFLDTHVSNGADYQYTLTLIHALRERLAPSIEQLTYLNFKPELEGKLAKHNFPIAPYVQPIQQIPDDGLEGFNDLPRYANGYASLFHCIAVTVETHMLKSFELRTKATRLYIDEVIRWAGKNQVEIQTARKSAFVWDQAQRIRPVKYKRTEQADTISFLGYEHGFKPSEVSGMDRLFYDRTKPFERNILYFNHFSATDTISIPNYYVLTHPNEHILERLASGGVQWKMCASDSIVSANSLRIQSYKSVSRPYEGHFLHSEIEVEEHPIQLRLQRGDVLISTNQNSRSFLIQSLEPTLEDSYFAWNFFDSYLQQKEYFSDYVFEDIAAEFLATHPEIRTQLEAKKRTDPEFAKNAWEQLYFVYKQTPYFEPTVNLLPVFKIF